MSAAYLYAILLELRPRITKSVISCQGYHWDSFHKIAVYWHAAQLKRCLASFWFKAKSLTPQELSDLRAFVRAYHEAA